MKSYPIENQVCTPEQAKKLAELLGDDAPESLYFWTEIPPNPYENQSKPKWIVIPSLYMNEKGYPAYSGDELGALLPAYLVLNNYDVSLNIWKVNDQFACAYERVIDNCPESEIEDEYTEAQAKAALAIQGLKDGWIKKKEFRYD